MTEPIQPAEARFIARANRTPPLERGEELELARALARGDIGAGQRILAANLRHVIPHALRYRYIGLPFAELIALGNLGLALALRGFDPDRGLRFSTYANHFIRSEMLAGARRARSVVSGGHQRPERHDASLDETGPVTGLASAPGQEQRVDRERLRGELGRAVANALGELGPRERYMVEHRLMADPETRHSLSELGTHFGVSRERARQIEQKLKERLRARLEPFKTRLPLLDAA